MTNDEKKAQIDKGTVIQVTGENVGDWEGCLLVVDEVKPWGVQAGMHIPEKGAAFIRLKWEDIDYIGQSYFMFGAGGDKNESNGKD